MTKIRNINVINFMDDYNTLCEVMVKGTKNTEFFNKRTLKMLVHWMGNDSFSKKYKITGRILISRTNNIPNGEDVDYININTIKRYKKELELYSKLINEKESRV